MVIYKALAMGTGQRKSITHTYMCTLLIVYIIVTNLLLLLYYNNSILYYITRVCIYCASSFLFTHRVCVSMLITITCTLRVYML